MPQPNEPGGATTRPNGPVCPECGQPVRPDANLCPNCGYALILIRKPRPTDGGDAGPKRKPDDRSEVEETIVSGRPVPPAPTGGVTTPPPTPRPPGLVCPSCGHENPTGRVRCEDCAANLIPTVTPAPPLPDPAPPPRPVPWGLIVGGVAAALIVVGVIAGTKAAWNAVHDDSTKATTSPTASPSTSGSTALALVDPTTIVATATSTLPNSTITNSTYGADNTLDGDATTAWNSDGDKTGDRGVGVELTYTFAAPVDLRMITILNGYQKVSGERDRFTENGRIQVMKVITESGKWVWSVKDDRAPQSLTEPFGKTSSVRLKVRAVYPGNKYFDLGLSEISFSAAAQ
jgi:hypothetical protein